MRNNLFIGVASIALIAPVAAIAQDTTSAISGQITNEGGAPVAGASVTALHVPSGTRATVETDASGNYALRGLRIGGPYTVTVSAPGYPDQIIDNVGLVVGDTFGLPVQMQPKEVVVTANRVAGSRELITRSQSAFNAGQIRDIVSARRDVRDIIRRDLLAAYNPNVGGVAIAGGNIRTQRFSVDGVQLQDSFGLNYGGLPSTRGIVSIEAIDQLSVKAAPFDISEGNFQGGAVNVVLKSGTNAYHVTAFGNFGGPSLTGNRTRDNRGAIGEVFPVGNTTIFDFRNYGGSVSGPIIKDKLFIAAAYEYLTEASPNTYGIAGSSAANLVPNLSQAQVDNVISAFGTAGYAPYNIGTIPVSIAEKDKKYSVKLDWNIAEGQRFSASWIHHENELPNFGTGAATGSNSPTAPYIQLQSDQYKLTEFNNAWAAQLNSQWSDEFSTEIRGAYRFYRRGQVSYFGPDYAQFNVCTDPTSQGGLYPSGQGALCSITAGAGNAIVRLGPDTARQANQFNNKQLTVNANAQLHVGDHTFKAEADYFRSRIYNLFSYGGSSQASGLTGGASGGYYFDSLADFQSRIANEYTLTIASTGNKNDAYVNWAYDIYTVGLQDTWKPSSTFTANAGVRIDMYGGDKTIGGNQNFLNRFSSLYPGLTNTATLAGRYKVQPRAGFNWKPVPSVRVAGGAGLFSGGLSDVFISNNFSNSGVAINSTGATVTGIDIVRTGGTAAAPTCRNLAIAGSVADQTPSPAVCAAALSNIAGNTPPQAVLDYIRQNSGVQASAYTNSLDPRFKLPAQWKFNLTGQWSPNFGDSLLASGWTFRADALHSRAQQAIRWIDLRAQPLVVNGVVQVAPDGRPRYGGNVAGAVPGSNYDIQLTNTTKGKAWIFAGGVQKEVGPVSLSASYTHQNVKDVAGVLTSSTVGSSYGVVTNSPNSGGAYGRSTFEVTHTIRANLDFKHKFFGDNETRFNINFEARSGQPWSQTMNDFTNAAVTNGNCPIATGRSCTFGTVSNTTSHLLYVPDFTQTPTNNGLTYGIVTFADAATRDNLIALVRGTKLRDYQGKIAPKNLLSGPWFHKVDLNFAQQVPFFFHSKITALASIENFLNLLNRDWGSYQDFGGSQTIVRVICSGAPTGGQTCPNYTYSAYSAPRTQSFAKASLYAIRRGARLYF